ncbi:MAG: TolC family protein [Lentisphaeria bacterium]|nr:TolC family protein [Lentisphaeria bacterium]
MKIVRKGMCGAAALAVLVCGCYNYKAPAAAALGDSYTERKKDSTDDMFKNIKTLSLLDAQRIAIKNNPTYIAAYHSVEAARMKYYQAWGAYSPTVSASFSMQNGHSWVRDSAGEPRVDAFNVGMGIQANMLIFDGFARFFKLKAAKSSLKYQEYMEENACRTMMLSVAYAYNTVLLAIEQRRIAMEDRKFQLESLQNTQYKFEAGAAPLSDVLNFEILVNNAEVKMIDADYSYDTAVYALAVLMGYPDGTLPVDLKFSENYKAQFTELPAVEIYLDAALANRPDLKAYREQLNIAKYQVYQAWGAYSPTVNGYVSMGFDADSIDKNYSYMGRRYTEDFALSYGVSANWTIFNGAIRYNQLREAQASMAATDFQVAAQWFNVVDEVRTAYANYIQSVKKTKLYDRVRELSAKQRDLVDDEYRAGNAELTRLNEAQRDLVEAETNLASSHINVQNAKAQLDAVVGGNTADYYLNDTNKNRQNSYPGLGNLPDAVGSTKSEAPAPAAGKKSVPAAKKQDAPAIPASATAK